MSQKFRVTLLAVMVLTLSDLSFAGTLPLNTGYDYSNWATYAYGVNDDYWIRYGSHPVMADGPSWAVDETGNGASWASPLAGPSGVPSTWINAFASDNKTPAGVNADEPAYAIFRKCFCLQPGYSNARIMGGVRNDETITMWMNLLINTVLPPTPINLNNPPTQIDYSNQAAFHAGRNCLFVLLEDTGVHTGFNLAANLTADNTTPIIAKGPNMSFEPCSCGQGAQTAASKKMYAEEQQTLQMIIKYAEARRLQRGVRRR